MSKKNKTVYSRLGDVLPKRKKSHKKAKIAGVGAASALMVGLLGTAFKAKEPKS